MPFTIAMLKTRGRRVCPAALQGHVKRRQQEHQAGLVIRPVNNKGNAPEGAFPFMPAYACLCLRLSLINFRLQPLPVRNSLANFKLRGLAHQHLHALFEQCTAVRITQLNVVVPRSKREFLGLLHAVGKSTVHVDRCIL
jgi:hypothetical protein